MVLADACFNITHSSFNENCEDILSESKRLGVNYFFCPAAEKKDIDEVIKFSSTYEEISCGIGIHPHHADEVDSELIKKLEALIINEDISAIGEIGLDYYRDFQHINTQKESFEVQLELASNYKVPVFLHNRNAFKDFYSILKKYFSNLPSGIVHCFTGNKSELLSLLDLGLYIGITGWVCDERRGADLNALLKYIPKDRLVIETDAPYLIPRNLKSKTKNNINTPMNLPHIAEHIANVRGESVNEIAEYTTENFKKLFTL
jgi:TatD DNase family protein